jgi:hypothetical protein
MSSPQAELFVPCCILATTLGESGWQVDNGFVLPQGVLKGHPIFNMLIWIAIAPITNPKGVKS